MAQQHMDRLSSVDVSFLTNESASSHMHVGGILIFE
jgi:diacylglycerol O-acyltransferase